MINISKYHLNYLGSINPDSESIIIGDPCYLHNDKNNIDDNNLFLKINNFVRNKPWIGYSILNKESRVKALIATCYKSEYNYPINKLEFLGNIGVDSGQAGIYNLSSMFQTISLDDFEKDENGNLKNEIIDKENMWYSLCCDKTLSEDMAGVFKGCIVSSSGWGDGCYDVWVGKIGDLVDFIMIEFDDDNEDEEDDFYSYGDSNDDLEEDYEEEDEDYEQDIPPDEK